MAFRLISDRTNLNWYTQQIIEGGGEGVILQKRGSIYKQGRSLEVVKLKVLKRRRLGKREEVGGLEGMSC